MASAVVFAKYLIIGGCVLTKLAAGPDRYATFYHQHLSKLFPDLPQYPIWLFMRFIAPVLIPAVAVWWQVGW